MNCRIASEARRGSDRQETDADGARDRSHRACPFREQFLQGEPVEAGVRTSILRSWQRSRSLGLSPDQASLPFRDDFDRDARIVRAAVPVLDRLQARFAGSKMNIS